MKNICEALVGRKLVNHWKVVSIKKRDKDSSGGQFSVSYIVERQTGASKETAFMKALNLSRAFRTPNFTIELEKLTATHNLERELLEFCKENKLKKIVRILDSGEVIPESDEEDFYPVPYLIFEIADGNVRDKLNMLKSFEPLWILQSLHSVTLGLMQLHNLGIAHQDLKPSNILFFEKAQDWKLSDLGRSDVKGRQAPHSNHRIAGDPAYAPPELLYGYVVEDWSLRRISGDLYQLGSMIFFYFTHTHATNHLKANLPIEFHWNNWQGEYMQVLPYLIDSLEISLKDLDEVLRQHYADQRIVDDLLQCTRQLCFPDPYKRGHPINLQLQGNRLSLERYVSIFDRSGKRFELERRRK